MNSFIPDYKCLQNAAKNIETKGYIPLYEHIISPNIMEKIMNVQFADLLSGDYSDKKEFFRNYCEFFMRHGYDTVSFEHCIGAAMPGAGLLGGHGLPPAITTREDFIKYPWDEIPNIYFNQSADYFKALCEVMPVGMKAIGGAGNGIFECAEEIIGYENLCYILGDDPELFADIFKKIGETNYEIWNRLLTEFADVFCVCRFGDDMGFKSAPLLPPDVIKENIIPEYSKIISLIHSFDKPFLLHSCGQIFDVMDDLISIAGIDAKHSNEDAIAPFPVWVEKYGDRIGNFGGIDTDAVCRLTRPELKEYIGEVVSKCVHHGGFAFGSGNSIPDYVPVEGFLNMNEIIREARAKL